MVNNICKKIILTLLISSLIFQQTTPLLADSCLRPVSTARSLVVFEPEADDADPDGRSRALALRVSTGIGALLPRMRINPRLFAQFASPDSEARMRDTFLGNEELIELLAQTNAFRRGTDVERSKEAVRDAIQTMLYGEFDAAIAATRRLADALSAKGADPAARFTLASMILGRGSEDVSEPKTIRVISDILRTVNPILANNLESLFSNNTGKQQNAFNLLFTSQLIEQAEAIHEETESGALCLLSARLIFKLINRIMQDTDSDRFLNLRSHIIVRFAHEITDELEDSQGQQPFVNELITYCGPVAMEFFLSVIDNLVIIQQRDDLRRQKGLAEAAETLLSCACYHWPDDIYRYLTGIYEGEASNATKAHYLYAMIFAARVMDTVAQKADESKRGTFVRMVEGIRATVLDEAIKICDDTEAADTCQVLIDSMPEFFVSRLEQAETYYANLDKPKRQFLFDRLLTVAREHNIRNALDRTMPFLLDELEQGNTTELQRKALLSDLLTGETLQAMPIDARNRLVAYIIPHHVELTREGSLSRATTRGMVIAGGTPAIQKCYDLWQGKKKEDKPEDRQLADSALLLCADAVSAYQTDQPQDISFANRLIMDFFTMEYFPTISAERKRVATEKEEAKKAIARAAERRKQIEKEIEQPKDTLRDKREELSGYAVVGQQIAEQAAIRSRYATEFNAIETATARREELEAQKATIVTRIAELKRDFSGSALHKRLNERGSGFEIDKLKYSPLEALKEVEHAIGVQTARIEEAGKAIGKNWKAILNPETARLAEAKTKLEDAIRNAEAKMQQLIREDEQCASRIKEGEVKLRDLGKTIVFADTKAAAMRLFLLSPVLTGNNATLCHNELIKPDPMDLLTCLCVLNNRYLKQSKNIQTARVNVEKLFSILLTEQANIGDIETTGPVICSELDFLSDLAEREIFIPEPGNGCLASGISALLTNTTTGNRRYPAWALKENEKALNLLTQLAAHEAGTRGRIAITLRVVYGEWIKDVFKTTAQPAQWDQSGRINLRPMAIMASVSTYFSVTDNPNELALLAYFIAKKVTTTCSSRTTASAYPSLVSDLRAMKERLQSLFGGQAVTVAGREKDKPIEVLPVIDNAISMLSPAEPPRARESARPKPGEAIRRLKLPGEQTFNAERFLPYAAIAVLPSLELTLDTSSAFAAAA